ncbi:hypothetical protein CEUSTIGMA_g7054.t1 [Chlamydomonas eustigma]|uniref:Uncharacterized protein n=1 Tax=Chlamydomonas eustigma TaxID=1157962 RepID=A0A250X955_9CHLO|nr:hypothetical protein CEUSTIGMA_g7054.t1 [Chlamydomonas eustigma]|eukprot:GAX79613.1 hypothetical protein CEUSTIGMA_g7054.t1 [Chlamydomonas eustigma]
MFGGTCRSVPAFALSMLIISGLVNWAMPHVGSSRIVQTAYSSHRHLLNSTQASNSTNSSLWPSTKVYNSSLLLMTSSNCTNSTNHTSNSSGYLLPCNFTTSGNNTNTSRINSTNLSMPVGDGNTQGKAATIPTDLPNPVNNTSNYGGFNFTNFTDYSGGGGGNDTIFMNLTDYGTVLNITGVSLSGTLSGPSVNAFKSALSSTLSSLLHFVNMVFGKR